MEVWLSGMFMMLVKSKNETMSSFLKSFSISQVYPPKEENAVFLTTNFQSTLDQVRGICKGTTKVRK